DLAVANRDQPLGLEAGQDAAHGLEFQAEQAADLLARHAQQEAVSREPARVQPLRQVDQERGQPFFGPHRPEQQHQRTLALDLAGEHPEQFALQRRLAACQRIELLERDLDDFAVLERDRIARIGFGADTVEAQHFASHVETRHLLASILGEQDRLERPRADAVQRMERRTEPVQVFAAAHPSPRAPRPCEQDFHVARLAGGPDRGSHPRGDRMELNGGGVLDLHRYYTPWLYCRIDQARVFPVSDELYRAARLARWRRRNGP